MGIAATVSRAPSDADDTLDLHWLSPRDGVDGEERVGEKDLRWVSTSRLPAVDDDALLLVDSQGDPWAFVWATGAIMGDAAASARLDALEATPPQARVFNSANIATTTGVLTALTFDSERYDEGSLHSTSANTGRLTAPITGLYSIGACVRFTANATGIRYVSIRLNGALALIFDTRPAVNGDATVVVVSTQYRLAAADYVETTVIQTSGGNLNVETTGNYSPEFWMHRVSA
jgi:hypothetical protein